MARVRVSPALRDSQVSGDTSEGSTRSGRTQPAAAGPRWRGWAGPGAGEGLACWLAWAAARGRSETERNTKRECDSFSLD